MNSGINTRAIQSCGRSRGNYDNALAGYYELRRNHAPSAPSYRDEYKGEVEIAYFGLLPDFIGRGLGSALLTSAIENAWAWAPTPSRVWVHTCNRDHPNALYNYQAGGFKIYKIEEGEPTHHLTAQPDYCPVARCPLYFG